MFELKVTVSEGDCEPHYNHVNHAHALTFLEKARLSFLEDMGFPNKGFMEKGLFFVIFAIEVRYKREILEGEIVVTCDEGWIEDRSVFVRQRIINDKGKVCLEATVESKFMSGESKRSVPPPADFAAAFIALVESRTCS